MEQIAAFLSLVGVVMIAQPTSLLGWDSSPPLTIPVDGIQGTNTTASTMSTDGKDDVTPAQRLVAIVVCLIGTCGAAGAYTTIRWIGKRAHPLISINYFATWCTIVSVVALAFPGVHFRLPSTLREWFLLIFLGLCGFVTQYLLTAGLAHEKSSRATQMVYSAILFALLFDKIIWDTTPGIWSIAGSSLILGSALYVAVKGDAARANAKVKVQSTEEEEGLMESTEHEIGGEGEGDGRGSIQELQEVQLRTLRT
jgi:drug/metabolite transporter (DMT)-like permease